MSDTGIDDLKIASDNVNDILTAAGIPGTAVGRKDGAGNTIYQTNQWWAAYEAVQTQLPQRLQNTGLATALTNYMARYNDEDPSAMTVARIAKQVGIPTSMFATSAGSGGKSAAQRQNDLRNLTFVVRNQAAQLGVPLSAETIAYIADVAEKQDYSSEQLMSVLVDLADWETVEPGQLKNQVDEIGTLARSHLVSLSDDTVKQYSERIANGSMSMDTVTNIIKTQARQAMPWLSSVIDQGLSPSDVMAAGRDQIAKALEITSGEVDLMDNKYLSMLTVQDEKAGTRLATSSEIERNVRKDVRWQKTKAAKEQTVGIGQMLSKVFGRSAF